MRQFLDPFTFSQGAKLLFNLSECDSTIKSLCNISLNENFTTGIENCSKLMIDFRSV